MPRDGGDLAAVLAGDCKQWAKYAVLLFFSLFFFWMEHNTSVLQIVQK